MPIKRALISVYDKTKLVVLAKALLDLGVEIHASSGTYQALRAAGLLVHSVETMTETAELFGGRVKTLHPKLHGAVLMKRDNAEHLTQAKAYGIKPIDLVVINLYPFLKASTRAASSSEEPNLADVIEMIDIGGPALLRAAAKNFANVTVVSAPDDYPRVIAELKNSGGTSETLRKELALKAFRLTAHYDQVIARRLTNKFDHGSFTSCVEQEKNTPTFSSATNSIERRPLRYGENPHQKAYLELRKDEHREAFSLAEARLLRGTPLSYNNILDSEAALRIIRELGTLTQINTAKNNHKSASAAVIKHGTPCGLAVAPSTATALKMALEGDVVSRYGSVIAVSECVDKKTATALSKIFVEIIIAPDYTQEGLEILNKKNKRMRILAVAGLMSKRHGAQTLLRREIEGGTLVQSPDEGISEYFEDMSPAGETTPSRALLAFAEISVKHTKSNAITIVVPFTEVEEQGYMLLGMGGGQPNRLDAVTKLAIPKMQENLTRLYPGEEERRQAARQAILASDAFFPFADSLRPIHQSGIQTVLQPGGSIRDAEVIAEAKRLQIHMIFTKRRHFYH